MARFNESNMPLPRYYTTPNSSQTDRGTTPYGVQDAAAGPDDSDDPDYDPQSEGKKRRKQRRVSQSETQETKKRKKIDNQEAKHERVSNTWIALEPRSDKPISNSRTSRGTPDEIIPGIPTESEPSRYPYAKTLSKSNQYPKKCTVCKDTYMIYHFWNKIRPGDPESRCIKCRITGIVTPKLERLNASAKPAHAYNVSRNELKRHTEELIEEWWTHVNDRCSRETISYEDYPKLVQWAEDFWSDGLPNTTQTSTYRAPEANMTAPTAEPQQPINTATHINLNTVQATKDDDDPHCLYGVSDDEAGDKGGPSDDTTTPSKIMAQPRDAEAPRILQDAVSSRSATASLSGDRVVQDAPRDDPSVNLALSPLPQRSDNQITIPVPAPVSIAPHQVPLGNSVQPTGQTETPPDTPEAARKHGIDQLRHSILPSIPDMNINRTSHDGQQDVLERVETVEPLPSGHSDTHDAIVRDIDNVIALGSALQHAKAKLTPQQLDTMVQLYELQSRFISKKITPELIKELTVFTKVCAKAQLV